MATAAANNFCKLVQDGTLKLPRQAGLDPIYNGIVVSEDMLLVSDRDACNVTLHRRHDGKLLATSDKLEQWACGICIINDMEICVTLWNSTIEIMSIQCTGDTGIITKVRILHAKTTFDECHGVSKFMDKVVVCGRKQATICWCIVSLNDGHVDTIHQICKGDYWSHLTTKNNMLYISCWVNSDETGVYAYDIRNPSKRKFKYKHEELTYPTGITVDTKGFIFVCNNRPPCIHHLTDRYELVTIYREGMSWDPYGSYLRDIIWDQKHGLLYLTCWRSNGIIVLRPEYSNQGNPYFRFY